MKAEVQFLSGFHVPIPVIPAKAGVHCFLWRECARNGRWNRLIVWPNTPDSNDSILIVYADYWSSQAMNSQAHLSAHCSTIVIPAQAGIYGFWGKNEFDAEAGIRNICSLHTLQRIADLELKLVIQLLWRLSVIIISASFARLRATGKEFVLVLLPKEIKKTNKNSWIAFLVSYI